MKNFCKFLTVVFAAFALSACGDKDKDSAAPVVPEPDNPPVIPSDPAAEEALLGQWKLTRWTVDKEFSNNIYLELLADHTFVLYEDITSHGFNKMTGSFTFDPDESLISGSYTGGTPWGSSYAVAIDDSAQTMYWTAVGTSDTSVYTRTEIPDNISRTSRAVPTEEGFRFL